MRAAALAVDAADVRDSPEQGAARYWVRFARNSFGWSGRGVVVATRDGLHFTSRRGGLIGYLRPRETLFVPSSRVTSVLREADGVRLHVRADTGETANLEFFAGSGAAAASLVAWLPEAQTVELDQLTRSRESSRSRSPRSWWPYALVGIGAVLVAAVILQTPDRSGPADVRVSEAVPVEAPASLVEPEPIPLRDLVASRAELRAAEERTAALKKQFGLELRSLMDGTISQADFDLTLKRGLIPQWERERAELASRLDRVSAQAGVLGRLDQSADLWGQALTRYSEGLREQRPEKVLEAFELIGRAQASESQAYSLLSDAERRTASAAAAMRERQASKKPIFTPAS